MLKGRFIAIQIYLKKQERNQINNLTLHLKHLEREEMKGILAKINKTKIWFFEKINKIDKPLARHIKKKEGEKSNQQN